MRGGGAVGGVDDDQRVGFVDRHDARRLDAPRQHAARIEHLHVRRLITRQARCDEQRRRLESYRTQIGERTATFLAIERLSRTHIDVDITIVVIVVS